VCVAAGHHASAAWVRMLIPIPPSTRRNIRLADVDAAAGPRKRAQMAEITGSLPVLYFR